MKITKPIMETTFKIKGSCEHCGFAYKGEIPATNDSYEILCPKCHEATQNYDEADIVDKNDKAEGYEFDYAETTFEIKK